MTGVTRLIENAKQMQAIANHFQDMHNLSIKASGIDIANQAKQAIEGPIRGFMNVR